MTPTESAALLVHGLRAAGYAVEELGRGHWKSQCPNPQHEDRAPSLGIDVRKHRWSGLPTVLVNCLVCGWGLAEACRAAGVEQWRVLNGNGPYLRSQPPAVTEPLTEGKLGRYREALLSPNRLEYLHDRRGLTLAAIDTFEVGYDEGVDRYVLPVRDARGALVNLRRYKPGAPPGQKMKNAMGHGRPARLYPCLPPSGWVLVVEGEWDALVARQHHLPACTGTHGAPTWLPEWSAALTGRKVAFAFDCDTAGREHAAKHAAEVAKHAAAVKVIDLGLGDGEDVSDWFLKYGRSSKDLRELISATPALDAGGEGARE